MKEGRLWQTLDIKLDKIFQLLNGRLAILWGYGQSGRFLEHIFRRRNRNLDYIIDNYKEYPSRLHIYTTSILSEVQIE